MKNILKEIGKASLYALIAQFIAWIIFIFIDETWSNLPKKTLTFIMIIILSLIFILYFFVMRRENDLCIYNMKRFKTTFLIVWSFLSVAISRFIIDMVQAGTFHKCNYDCYIPLGAEFYLFGHLAILLVFFILLLEGIALFMNHFDIHSFSFKTANEDSHTKENIEIKGHKKSKDKKNKLQEPKEKNGDIQ